MLTLTLLMQRVSTPLIGAAKNGCIEVVRVLLQSKAAVNAQDTQGRSALMEASKAGHADVCQQLLNCKASTELADEAGMTALGHAVMNGNDAIVQLLGGREAQTDLNAFKGRIRGQIMMQKRNPAPLQAVSPCTVVEPVSSVVLPSTPLVPVASQPALEALVDEDEKEAIELSLRLHQQAEQQEALLRKDAEYALQLKEAWVREQQQQAEEFARWLQEQEDAALAEYKKDTEYAARLQREVNDKESDFEADSALALELHNEEYARQIQAKLEREDAAVFADEAFAQQLVGQGQLGLRLSRE